MLIPHEHGAYGQLGFPIAAAMAAGYPSVASLALTAGLIAAFLAHESLLVLLGARGPRAHRERRTEAIRDGALLSLLAVAGISVGVAHMSPQDRWAVLVPTACAAVIFALVVRHVEKTTGGEMFVALTCASCALPVGAASGVPLGATALIWLVMTLGYWAATAAVRGTIAKQRRERHAMLRVGGAFLALVAAPCVFLMARVFGLRSHVWIASVPLSALSLILVAAPPPARHLRRIGWALIAASVLTTILLAILVRG